MKTFMFKRLRSALLVLPLLAVGALAGCTAQVGAPEDTTAQGADLVTITPGDVKPNVGDHAAAQAPNDLRLENRIKGQRPIGPIDPDQVQNGNGSDPDPSPWVETPGGADPDPSPWMTQSSASSSQQTK